MQRWALVNTGPSGFMKGWELGPTVDVGLVM